MSEYRNNIVLKGISASEQAALDGVTKGTVTASKAIVVDANKDIGDFRNVDATNVDAGASGTAGSIDVFPGTASRGKLAITCTNQTGNTTVTLNANAMGQASTFNLADPGAASAFIVAGSAATTLAQADILRSITATAAEINLNASQIGSVTVTNGTPAGQTQTATVQLKNAAGTNLSAVRMLNVYMTTDANGTASGTGAATSATVSTGKLIKANTTKLNFDVLTDSSGVCVLTFDHTGGTGSYTDRVAVVNPAFGNLTVGSALAVST